MVHHSAVPALERQIPHWKQMCVLYIDTHKAFIFYDGWKWVSGAVASGCSDSWTALAVVELSRAVCGILWSAAADKWCKRSKTSDKLTFHPDKPPLKCRQYTNIEVLLFFFVKPEAAWGCILINSLNAKHYSSEPQNMRVNYNRFYDYCYYWKLTKPLSEKEYASHLVLWLLYLWVTPCRAGLGSN